jgi:hypothetical protein
MLNGVAVNEAPPLVSSSITPSAALPVKSQVGSGNLFFLAGSAFAHLRPAGSRSRHATLSIEGSDSFVASASIATGGANQPPRPSGSCTR